MLDLHLTPGTFRVTYIKLVLANRVHSRNSVRIEMHFRTQLSIALGFLAFLAGCSFDRGGFGRFAPCVSDDQCSEGRCIDGYCVQSVRTPYDGDDAEMDLSFEDVDPDMAGDTLLPPDTDTGSGDDPGDDSFEDAMLDVRDDPVLPDTEPSDQGTDSDVFDLPDFVDMPDIPDEPDALDLADFPDVTDVTECVPDTLYCDDEGDARQCTAAGTPGDVVEPCAFTCAGGVCQENFCGDGYYVPADGEQCDDENTTACDGCEGCARLSVGKPTSATKTASEVVWAPNDVNFTLEAWVYANGDGALFGIGSVASADYAVAEIRGGVPVFGINMGDGVIEVAGGSSVVDGWHHLAFQRFAYHGAVVFVDGQLTNLVHHPQNASQINGSTRIWIGSEGTVTSFDGRIDELRLTNGARYLEHFVPARRFTPDEYTVALYHMDAGVGSVVTDATGSGRDLTLNGWGWAIDNCYGGSPSAAVCGDGNLAPWEGCDDDSGSCTACVSDDNCGGRLDPSGTCVAGYDRAKWTDARGTCQGGGGDLYVIENEMENDWITYLIGLGDSYWIGLNDRDSEGSWVWSGGGSSGYRNWAGGQPDNWFDEDCTVINWGSSRQWNDEDCGSRKPYLCGYE